MIPAELVDLVLQKFPGVQKEQPPPKAYSDGVPILLSPPHLIVEVALFLRDAPELAMDLLKNLTAVDYGDRMTLVCHLFSLKKRHKVTLKVNLDRLEPKVESLSGIWPAANWQEREVFDLFGVQFLHHPDLRRIMLPEDWTGHPLRKDYVHEPDQYD